jgi:branched-chain amino acid transport system permease protein
MAGLLITVQFGGLGFAGGAYLGLKALVGAILGGIGSVPGAMLGGIVIAMLESLWSATLPIIWRDAFIFSLLSVFLVFRPNGFMGYQQDQPLNRHL